MLEDAADPAARSAASFRAQIGDLLGKMREIEGEVRPGTCEPTQFLRLKLRPGVEVVRVKLLRARAGHASNLRSWRLRSNLGPLQAGIDEQASRYPTQTCASSALAWTWP